MSNLKVKQRIKEGLSNEPAKTGRYRAFTVIRPGMLKMTALHPEYRENLRKIKEYSIENLPTLLEQAVNSLEEKGCKVFIADSPEEAKEYIGKIVQKGIVVKSKTNAGKEIGIVEYLENQGAKVVETDLGDRMNQLAKTPASHSLAPALHHPIEKWAEVFSEEMGTPIECDLQELVKAARKNLRHFLERADVGISGANAVVAETGSVLVTENEGNIRAVTSMPKVHIAIAGIEKIVPKLNDGIAVVKAAAAFGVGQDIGTYVSIISGPSKYSNDKFQMLGAGQGPEEVHIVLLRYGRLETIDADFKEALYCINCGSCLNFCPIYGGIGEKYGQKYLGGRGTAFTAFHMNLEKALEAGLFLCVNCKKCVECCAVSIDTPKMLSRLRMKAVEENGLEWTKKTVFNLLKENKLSKYTKLARSFQDLGLKRKADRKTGNMRFGLPGISGLPTERLVPTLAEKSFSEITKKRKAVSNPKYKVAFFAGCVVNYSKPELGKNLIELLESNGVEVTTFKEEACCGLPVLMSGAKDQFTELASKNIELITQKKFDYLLFVCPSCATTVKHEWKDVVEENKGLSEKYDYLADKVMDINKFIVDVLKIKPKNPLNISVTYHDPCHLNRGLGVKDEPRKIMQSIPNLELKEMKDSDLCCGFGGSFSLFYYDLSKAINNEKIANIMETNADYVATSCPGCMIQLGDGLNRNSGKQKVVHIVELLNMAYKGGLK